MKTKTFLTALAVAIAPLAPAAPLTESTFTEIIKDVNTLRPDSSAATAKLSDVLKSPDRVRTGA